MIDQSAYIIRETLVSIAINVGINLLVFYLIFGFEGPIAVWGIGNWAFDFLPLSFIVTLMCVLVPGAMAIKNMRAGKIAPLNHRSRLPRNLVVRALSMAAAVAIFGSVAMAALAALSGLDMLAVAPALAIKLAYAAALGAIITPIGLRAALSS